MSKDKKVILFLYDDTENCDIEKVISITIKDIVNMPNNPDTDEVIRNYLLENYGEKYSLHHSCYDIDEEITIT